MKKKVTLVRVQTVKEKVYMYDFRKINSPQTARDLFSKLDFFVNSDREMFLVASLNTKNEPTQIEVISVGSLNASIVHPREVFKSAIISNAASIICAHNHPSGDLKPSNEDIEVTKRLVEAGKLLGIDVLDHIIMNDEGEYKSIRELHPHIF